MSRFQLWLQSVDKLLLELFYGDTLDDMEPLTVQPSTVENPDTLLPWNTIENSHHNVRVLCDLAGLSLVPNVPIRLADGSIKMYTPKDIIAACIEVESNFQSYYLTGENAGKPVEHQNIVNGVVASTDWGIVQCNDYYHIGEGKDFASVEYVLDNPIACVNWMIGKYKIGQITEWVSYTSGEYRQCLP